MKRHALALAVLMVSVAMPASSPIEACGDKFMQVGRGLAFDEVYRARYPGAVVIYSPRGRASSDDTKLQASLTRAGHRVTVVRETLAASAVSAMKADVVLTPLDEAGTIGSQAKTATTSPTVLPVMPTGNRTEKAACKQQAFTCDLKAQDSPENFIVAVNKTMTDRAKARSRADQRR